jgi:DNA-binding transcriptional MerR regulator
LARRWQFRLQANLRRHFPRHVLTLELTQGFMMRAGVRVMNGLTVGAVALEANVTPDAVRYYERLKLLPTTTRTPAGYRLFDNAAVDRVRAIRQAQALGMSLAEIRELFPQGQLGKAECRRVRTLLSKKIKETSEHIARLQGFHHDLRRYLAACDRAIQSGTDVTCPIFARAEPKPASSGSGRRR